MLKLDQSCAILPPAWANFLEEHFFSTTRQGSDCKSKVPLGKGHGLHPLKARTRLLAGLAARLAAKLARARSRFGGDAFARLDRASWPSMQRRALRAEGCG